MSAQLAQDLQPYRRKYIWRNWWLSFNLLVDLINISYLGRQIILWCKYLHRHTDTFLPQTQNPQDCRCPPDWSWRSLPSLSHWRTAGEDQQPCSKHTITSVGQTVACTVTTYNYLKQVWDYSLTYNCKRSRLFYSICNHEVQHTAALWWASHHKQMHVNCSAP